MEEQHDVVAPIFKTKDTPVSKAAFVSQPAVKIKVENIFN